MLYSENELPGQRSKAESVHARLSSSSHGIVVHPLDDTTAFLSSAYSSMEGRLDVYRTGIDKEGLSRAIASSQGPLLMCGHGSPSGLFSVETSPDLYLIDDEVVPSIRQRGSSKNLFIWCFAKQFVRKYNLRGFYTDMFISEVAEASLMGLTVSNDEVAESNELFSLTLAEVINEPPREIFDYVTHRYSDASSAVVSYNALRLGYHAG